MIEASHKKWADLIFHPYLHGLLNHHFYAVHLFGPVPDIQPLRPLLVLPNHSSWWDGFFIYLLNKKRLHRKIYLMMLERQLKQNRFFRFLGAYSIAPDHAKGVKRSLEYTMDLLKRQNEPTLICFFPQGKLLPWHIRPVHFGRGLEFIFNRIENEIQLCFLGIRIEFLEQQRPEVFMELSPLKIIRPKSDFSLSEFESEFNIFLDRLERRIVKGDHGSRLFQGKKSINEQVRMFGKCD
ncbi:lysophospholipid acyltransferase family protein [bacterium]|nr:lysophospholipid acyltransferase family protein [bacterium]